MHSSGNTAQSVWPWGVAAAAVTVLVFGVTAGFPFFPFWDDDIHVHANPYLTSLSWEGIGAFWVGPYQQLYIPLTYTIWAGLAAVSRAAAGLPVTARELNAAWFHGANILVHTASTMLAFALLRRVTRKFFPHAGERVVSTAAALGAGFFALHPLQTEPVAWISGLRDVLGGCLGLAALAVLFSRDTPTRTCWAWATILYVASLAAKPAGVALPVVAALLAWYPFRWNWRTMVTTLGPWIAIGILWVILTSQAQWAAELARGLVPVWMRPLVAADALAFYTWKVLWPVGLSADYGRAPDVARVAGWLWWTWVGPAALTAVLVSMKRLRIYLVPWGVFAAALLPTLGLMPFNFQVVSTVADRYAYFALLGPAMSLAMIVVQARRNWITGLAAFWVATLAFLTILRLPLWSDDLRLFAATLETNPRSWKAMHNYASALDDRGRSLEAEPLLRRVIIMRPDSAEAHNDLGVILWKIGRPDEASAMMRQSLALRTTAATARNLLQMESLRGNVSGQIEALRVIVELEPENAEAGRLLQQAESAH
jgi:hypothetical protein